MKIGGPKGPIKPPKPEAKTEPQGSTGEVRDFEQVLGAGANKPAAANAAVFEALAAQLKSGAITTDAAKQELVTRVVEQHGQSLNAQQRERLTQALRQVLEQDPLLARRMDAAAE